MRFDLSKTTVNKNFWQAGHESEDAASYVACADDDDLSYVLRFMMLISLAAIDRQGR